MKTRCKKLMLTCTTAIVTAGLFVPAQDVKKDKNKKNVTIEDFQPVCPDLPKQKKPRVAVVNFKLNAPKDQFGGNLAIGLITALQKVQRFRASLKNYQFTLEQSIVTPKTMA